MMCLTLTFHAHTDFFTVYRDIQRNFHHFLHEKAPNTCDLSILTRLIGATEQIACKTLKLLQILPLHYKAFNFRGRPLPMYLAGASTLDPR